MGLSNFTIGQHLAICAPRNHKSSQTFLDTSLLIVKERDSCGKNVGDCGYL